MPATYVIEHGDVWLKPEVRRGERAQSFSTLAHVCRGSEDLAVAIVDDAMVKCGSAASVDAWRRKNEGVFDIVVVSFPVSPETVAELNACVENGNRAATLAERFAEIGAANPSLAEIPRYPR